MNLNIEVKNIEKAIDKLNRLNELLTEAQKLKEELDSIDVELVTDEVYPNVKQEGF
ncbi:hypothetical protein AABD40_08915 [Staphylococcus shinii]|uniref:hypothetical protein n=1 Tax=Staphylococcus shinii TaxID=2912228 RepID=UPI00298EF220|nr:hypothetical protein [Staphylococcus shinii]MDW8571198.1 hypothetical protein [Staphylococcus shinii]MDW8572897.1 hypothetical protein [Staphylococcus shinii]